MASTSSYLEQGYDKLLRYCSNEFRTVGRDPHLEVNPLLRMAIARLRKRPELIRYSLLVAFYCQVLTQNKAKFLRPSPKHGKRHSHQHSLPPSREAVHLVTPDLLNCMPMIPFDMSATCWLGCINRSLLNESSWRAFSE